MVVTTKYIFVTGGMVPSYDKGIIVAFLARLLQFRGYKVAIQKFDSCLNVDFGIIRGECFVTADGYEAGNELGRYERFADVETTRQNYITLGHVYKSVMDKECRGDYNGEIVKLTPHVTDEIVRRIMVLGSTGKYDFVITELGGKGDDVDSFPYAEALRLFKKVHKQDCVCVHIADTSEDTLSCDETITDVVIPFQKVCVWQKQHIHGMDEEVLGKFGIINGDRFDSTEWDEFISRKNAATRVLKIGIVGKYADLENAYEAVNASIEISAVYNDVKSEIKYICSDKFNIGNVDELLNGMDGVIVASDFNTHSIEGKLVALKWCREHDIPTLGIGQGMQSMVIEFARNMVGLKEANSTETDSKTPYNVIDVMAEQKNHSISGGIMRLGNYKCNLVEGSVAKKAYGRNTIQERHRHSHELNNDYRERLEAAGMRCTGINPETNLVEVVELPEYAWYVGVQYHPEFNCTVLRPNPLLKDFVRATKETKKK